MIETVIRYTCDLCLDSNMEQPSSHNWTIISDVYLIAESPLHFCPRCSSLAQRLFALLSTPFDFVDRDYLPGNEFNILKPCDLSVLFAEPATDKKVAPAITKGWQAQLDRIHKALSAALEELDDSEGDPRTCIEYALGQVRKLGLFGGLKEEKE